MDCFTCGDTDPEFIATYLDERLTARFPGLLRTRKDRVDRFLTEG